MKRKGRRIKLPKAPCRVKAFLSQDSQKNEKMHSFTLRCRMSTCTPEMPDPSEMVRSTLNESLLNSCGACSGLLKSRYKRSWAISKEASPPSTTKLCGVAGVSGALGAASACK